MNVFLFDLQQQLHKERDKAERDAQFMWWGHMDHLLAARQVHRPPPLAEPERSAWLHALERNVRLSLGLTPFPRRTDLRARLVGVVQREGCVIEKIVFQPRPGFVVPAHLYLPVDAPKPWPGVVYASGHFVEDGIMHPASQSCCITLAKMGFAVLAYEAMGQGERGPHWDEFRRMWLPALERSARLQGLWQEMADETEKRRWMGWAWHCLHAEHGQLPPLLVGLQQMGLMVWESIRALDYLCSRADIDATRLGMVGASGGGQNAYYTAALDQRVKAVACICYLPSLSETIRLSRGTNWWGGGDLCDQIPSHLTYAEFIDVGALILPRPLLFVAAQQDDGFPIEVTRAEYRRLAPVYEALAPGRLSLVEVPGPHGLSKPMREEAYTWFARWLQGEDEHPKVAEPQLTTESPTSSEMHCLLNQQWASSRPAVLRLSAALAARYARLRRRELISQDWVYCRSQLLERIRQILGPAPPDRVLVQELARTKHAGMGSELVCLRLESGSRVFATIVHGKESRQGRPLILAVHNGDWDSIWMDGWVEGLLERECDVAILDVRGLGPGKLHTSRPADRLQALEEILLCQDRDGAFVTDFEISSTYLMLGRTLLAEQVGDVRVFVDWIASRTMAPTAIKCLGVGYGGLVAQFAATMDSRIEAVATWRGPVSLQALIVQEPVYPASSFPFAALRHIDLPEVMAAVAPRMALVANAVDGCGYSVSAAELSHTYHWTAEAYAALGVSKRWQTMVGPPAETRQAVCEWLSQ